MNPNQPDLIVYSAAQQERLVVEVQASARRQDYDDEWLLTVRRRYGREGCYFLLVTAENLFLWLPDAEPQAVPAYIMDATSVLAERVDTQRFPLQSLDASQLESIVYAWLMLSQFTPAEQLQAESEQRWLVTSGLHQAIYQGDLMRQAA